MFRKLKRAVWKSCKANWSSKTTWTPIYIWTTKIKTQPFVKRPTDTKTSRFQTKREEGHTVPLRITTFSNRKWFLALVELLVFSESIQPTESKAESWIWTILIKDNSQLKLEAIEVAANKIITWTSFTRTIRKSIILRFSITRETWATWVSTVRELKTQTTRLPKNKYWHRLDKEMLLMLRIHRIVFYSSWTYQELDLTDCRIITPCQLVTLPTASTTTALWAMAACIPSWATKITDQIATTGRIPQTEWSTFKIKIRTFIKNQDNWATLSCNSSRRKPTCSNRPRSRCKLLWTHKTSKPLFNNCKCQSTTSKW